jgi:hypothetical protein
MERYETAYFDTDRDCSLLLLLNICPPTDSASSRTPFLVPLLLRQPWNDLFFCKLSLPIILCEIRFHTDKLERNLSGFLFTFEPT